MTRAGVDPATFGILLTVYTGAYLIAMSAGGALAQSFGVERVLPVSAIVYGATLCGLLNAATKAEVAVALIVAGFLGGVVDVTMNAEGAESSGGSAGGSWPGCTPQRRPAWRSARFSAA